MQQEHRHLPEIDWGEKTIERMVRKFVITIEGNEYRGFAVTGAESDEYVEWDNLADIDSILSRNPQLRKAIEEKLLRELWEMT